MTALVYLQRHAWALLGLAALAVVLTSALVILFHPRTPPPINSYAACVEAGHPIIETNPPTCRDGNHSFIGPRATPPLPVPPASLVDFEILVDGDTHASLPDHHQTYITNSAEWGTYWRTVHAGLATLPPLIPVDFTKSEVVAASLGPKPTSGYGLKVTSIQVTPAGTVVHLAEIIPTITCQVTQSVTNRYLIVRTAKLTAPVSFRISANKRTCP